MFHHYYQTVPDHVVVKIMISIPQSKLNSAHEVGNLRMLQMARLGLQQQQTIFFTYLLDLHKFISHSIPNSNKLDFLISRIIYFSEK